MNCILHALQAAYSKYAEHHVMNLSFSWFPSSLITEIPEEKKVAWNTDEGLMFSHSYFKREFNTARED